MNLINGIAKYAKIIDQKAARLFKPLSVQEKEAFCRLKVDQSAKQLENFLRVSTEELKDFARLTSNNDVHGLAVSDLCTTIAHV